MKPYRYKVCSVFNNSIGFSNLGVIFSTKLIIVEIDQQSYLNNLSNCLIYKSVKIPTLSSFWILASDKFSPYSCIDCVINMN